MLLTASLDKYVKVLECPLKRRLRQSLFLGFLALLGVGPETNATDVHACIYWT